MAIKQIDPRMINPNITLVMNGSRFTSTTAVNVSGTRVAVQSLTADSAVLTTISTPSGSSNFWNAACTLVQQNSSLWEESADISAITTTVATNSANWTSAYATTTALSSNFWNVTYTLVQQNSASWEESADILPTVTNYLSTNLIAVSSLNVTKQLLSANTDLINIFLTPTNTLTTSVCAMSGNGIIPFIMNFTNGLLTSITF